MLISCGKWIAVAVCIALALFWYACGWVRIQDGHKVFWEAPGLPGWYDWLFVASAVITILLWHADRLPGRTGDPRRLRVALIESILAATCVFLLFLVFLEPSVTPGSSLMQRAWAEWSWIPGVLVAIGVGAAVARWRYKVPPDSEPRCETCGYLLRGLPEARCPECGTPFDPDIGNRGNA